MVICISKNLIWTTLNVIFSYLIFFLHPQIPDFQIVYIGQYCPIIIKYTSMESFNYYYSFISILKKKQTFMTIFVVQGHICEMYTFRLMQLYVIEVFYLFSHVVHLVKYLRHALVTSGYL